LAVEPLEAAKPLGEWGGDFGISRGFTVRSWRLRREKTPLLARQKYRQLLRLEGRKERCGSGGWTTNMLMGNFEH